MNLTKTTTSRPGRQGAAMLKGLGMLTSRPLGLQDETAPKEAAAAETVVEYLESSEIIANPERGFVRTTETHYRADGAGHTPLNPKVLRSYREEGVTQIVRVLYREKCVDQPSLDPQWLEFVHADFDVGSESGISVVPRFAYVQGGVFPFTVPYGDAPFEIVPGHIK